MCRGGNEISLLNDAFDRTINAAIGAGVVWPLLWSGGARDSGSTGPALGLYGLLPTLLSFALLAAGGAADTRDFAEEMVQRHRRTPTYKTRADSPAEESVATALLSNETNVSAPIHFPS